MQNADFKQRLLMYTDEINIFFILEKAMFFFNYDSLTIA